MNHVAEVQMSHTEAQEYQRCSYPTLQTSPYVTLFEETAQNPVLYTKDFPIRPTDTTAHSASDSTPAGQ